MKIDWIEKYLDEAEKLMYNNETERGLSLLSNLLYEEPGHGGLHNHLGWAYLYYTTDVAKAELHLKLAVRFDAAFSAPYLHLGALLIRLARYDEALTYLETGLTKYNANRVAFLESLAHVYELKREYGKAISMYKEALASTIGFEYFNLTEGIKRCRKKRWVMLFSF